MKLVLALCLTGAFAFAHPVEEPDNSSPALAPAFQQFGVPLTNLPGPDISRLPPFYQQMVATLMATSPEDRPPLAFCFAPGTDEEIVRTVSQLIYNVDSPLDYQINPRWSSTASGNTGGQGDPITITYSFVPDGVSIPNGIGEGVAPNELYVRMNALFGSETTWKAKFAQVFARWSDLCGVNYVEVADDGAALFSSTGVLGQRGDVRICMKLLDGTNGVLAYNYFPNTGDMVLDRAENWASSSNDFRFLRNIVAHEHGHGLGLRHVCPINQTKLMEPYLSLSFDGPRHDDIRGNQRQYGDAFENNNTAAAATNLGTISGAYTLNDVSSDDNSDLDWYRFTVDAGQQVSITLDIVGASYLEGAQNADGTCSAGATYNSLDDNNLSIRLYDGTGTVLLAEAASQPAGVDEVIPNTVLPGAGNYCVEVLSGTNDAVQLYNLAVDVTALPLPLLSVSVPNGGESWNLGSSQTIGWSWVNLTGNVRVELNRSYPAGTWETIDANAANDGSELWTVSGTTGTACRVRVISLLVPAVGDTSDANFSIAAPPGLITVVTPNGGETWRLTDTTSFLWTSSGITGNMRIELNRGFPGGAWETLFANTPDDGSEVWIVSGATSNTCRARVVSTDDPTASDSSNSNFVIAPSPEPVTDLVIRIAGTDVILTWTATVASNYNIYSAFTSDGSFSTLVGSTSASSLIIPNGTAAGSQLFYQVVAIEN